MPNSYWQKSGEAIENLENLHNYKSARQAPEIIKEIGWYEILTRDITLTFGKKNHITEKVVDILIKIKIPQSALPKRYIITF